MKTFIKSISICSIIFLTSCKTSFTTAYRVSTQERNYYCNNPKIVNDTIFGAELRRNGKIHKVFAIPMNRVIEIKSNETKW